MQEEAIRKNVYLKFNFPEKLKYKKLKNNDECKKFKENFSFEKKKGPVPMEHEFKVNSSLFIFYQIPKIFNNKVKMKQQLLNSELVDFKYNVLLNELSDNSNSNYEKIKIIDSNGNKQSKLEDIVSIKENELDNTVPINKNEIIDFLPKNENEFPENENVFPNTKSINENDLLNIIPMNEDNLPNTIPINESNLPNTIPMNEDNLPNTIPINESNLPNTIPVNENNLLNTLPINEGDLPNTIPINENEFPNTTPIDEYGLPNTIPVNESNLPNTIPMNEDNLPNTIPINENYLLNTIPINENYLPNTIPINENDFPNTIPVNENDFPNTIPVNENGTVPENNIESNNIDRQLSNSSSTSNSSSNRNPTFIRPDDPLLPNNSNNNNNTQPYELINDFSQATQTQNYEPSYIATQEYVEMDTQECIQDLNDETDIRDKYNDYDDVVIPGTESEFEQSVGYSLSYLNRNCSDLDDDDDISNKRSFLQLDDYDSIITDSNAYSSSKRKKIDHSDSDSDEIFARQSDDENGGKSNNNNNNKSRRTVSDLTSNSNHKDKNKCNELKNSLSQECNPMMLDSQNLNSPEFISPINEERNKNQNYMETQIVSQTTSQITNIKENKILDTQKISSLSQESIIFSPPNRSDNQKLQQSQEYMFISPSDTHQFMGTEKMSSQKEELISPRNNQYNESPKILSPEDDLLSPRTQQLIETQKIELDENDDDIIMEKKEYYMETQRMSSQGEELLSPENNFENELNIETQKIELDTQSPLSTRNNVDLNQIQLITTQKVSSQDVDLLSPKNNIFADTQNVLSSEARINYDVDMAISDDESNSQSHSSQSKSSMKSPDLLLPKINLNQKYPLSKRIKYKKHGKETPIIDKTVSPINFLSPTLDLLLPENNTLIEGQKKLSQNEALPLEIEEDYHIEKSYLQENEKENKKSNKDPDNASYFCLNSRLNNDQENIFDEKSIDNIKLLPSQNDDIIQEDIDQSINNSQCSSNNPLFSPRYSQEDPLSPELIDIKKGNNFHSIANKENVNSNKINVTEIHNIDLDKENEDNIKNKNINDILDKNKIQESEMITKTPDFEFMKESIEPPENHSNNSLLKNENFQQLVKTNSNIFTDNNSKSLLENEKIEDGIINSVFEEYYNKTNIPDYFNDSIFTGNILDELKSNSSLDKINKKKKLKGKEIMSGSSQESSDNNNLFYSSPIPVYKARNSDDLSLLSEKEIKEELGHAFGDLSLDNKLNNENESNEKASTSLDKLNTSGLIITPGQVQTPNNKIPTISLIKETSDKKKHPLYLNNSNKDDSFINMNNNTEIISPESSLIMNTPTPIDINYTYNTKNQRFYINKNKNNENNNLLNVNTYKSNSLASSSSPKKVKDHSLNSLSFINIPKHSPGKLQQMLSSQSSDPRDFGIPSSIPKTISSISSFEDIEEGKRSTIILPSNIEIVDSLEFLAKEYEKNVSTQESQGYDNKNKNSIRTYKPKKKYNFIGIVVHINNIDSIQPRNQNKTVNIFDNTDKSIQISSVLISDQSRSFFPVIFWRNNSNWVEKISVGDIILFINFSLSKFKNKVMANTVGWGNNNYSSHFYVIKNINSRSTINLSNDNTIIINRVLNIQNWAKDDFFTKFLFKDSDQFSSEPQSNISTFITVKQLVKYKNKCVNIQGIPISIMKDVKISDDHESYELWKVEIIDMDNNKATIQILMLLSDLIHYININEQQIYDFYDLIIHEEPNKDLILYATKFTRIQTPNDIPEEIQKKMIEYLKDIEPKDFDSIESLIKLRYNAFISKIIFNRTNNPDPLEYSIVTTQSYKSSKKRDSINDILDTIQIYCKKCNKFLFQQDAINITSLINGIQYKDTVDQKINYFINFLVQKAFWDHCHHLKELMYIYSPIQLILQDCINDVYQSSQEMSSSPLSSPSSSPITINSKFNSLFVFLDIHATEQFYQKFKPEDFIKIRGGLKRRGRKPTNTHKQITLTMVQNHLRKMDPFKLALANTQDSMGDSAPDQSNLSSTPDYTSKSVDLTQATIFEDILTILSFENDPTIKIDFDTDRQVSLWNQNLNKYLRPLKRKKNAFVLSCNIQENELKTNLYNIGPIYCKDFRKH
ncbi:hypothetical protein PIROE2DRAFT_7765 [Piromyces sp. E2]|nr:hypothetical protein PIROE2DRAFT_7765 [Piromyces sp. E2]|eukprot:OUM65226.1 hypothetical protein PIROE2DRAFT_7765 [Piromyces sp. E2]